MDQKKIGEFIANLRKEKGLTQKQLAEENMMTLIKESEKNKKKQTNAVVTLVLSVVGVLAAFLITLLFTEQFMYSVWMYFDIPSFLAIFIPTVIIVTTAGFGKDFSELLLLWERIEVNIQKYR